MQDYAESQKIENDLFIKTVATICDEKDNFRIPSYQRGYRWDETQVTELLNDLYVFFKSNTNGEEIYCLQPVVLKNKTGPDGKAYLEVIDGQQRLTTVYLILLYIEKQRGNLGDIDRLFTIEYETRKRSKEFLKDPKKDSKNDNIDFFYIYNAYEAIDTWVKNKNLGRSLANFEENIEIRTEFIWYETKEDNPINAFTRLNDGKIGLTDAELVKALFLNSKNFNSDGSASHDVSERQMEIAKEWDNIEYALQDDRLWYFLTDEEKYDNRIGHIFELMMKVNDNGAKENSYHGIFNWLNSWFDDQIQEGKTVADIWNDVNGQYQRLNEWFSDRELYHKIGFIIYVSKDPVKDLLKEEEDSNKNSFRKYIDDVIVDHFKKYKSEKKLKDLDYEEDKNEISEILLLYNILTTLQDTKSHFYFPFDSFKKGKYDLEHIDSRTDAGIGNIKPEYRETWLYDCRTLINDQGLMNEKHDAQDLLNEIDNIKSEDFDNDSVFERIFDDIVDALSLYDDDSDEKDKISNLALLDQGTNRSYKNNIFAFKRQVIIKREQGLDDDDNTLEEKDRVYIPVCTKNVFLKSLPGTSYKSPISFWTDNDKDLYLDNIKNTVGNYLPDIIGEDKK